MSTDPSVTPGSVPVSLIDCFGTMPDPRLDRTRCHKLIDILVIGFCATLAGGEGFSDMEQFGLSKEAWFRGFLELPNGIPSHDTFNRVFQALDPAAFGERFVRWTQGLRAAVSGEIVAIDGKALRRALGKGKGDALPYVVSAWASDNGLVLGQMKVDEKSNEITAIPQLLRALELKGCIVTIDAMGCQRKIAREIVDADADYVLALKGNQETVHDEVRSYMDDAIARWQENPGSDQELGHCETVEKDHGRIETRRFWQSCDTGWFADRSKWEGLKSFGAVESVREVAGAVTIERRYFLLSLGRGVWTFARAARLHWGIENKVHWLLDVTFREDQSRARHGHAAQNLATLRRLALNAAKRENTKLSTRLKVKKAGWSNDYLLALLGIDPA
ncbi:MAG: ISAs1 family transposase [Lentisphaerae bacterium]|nr:ISAs1 family transposase [Lentisphaerota bacterium]